MTMRRMTLDGWWCCLVLTLVCSAAAEGYTPATVPSAFAVETVDHTWTDRDRSDRAVPVRMYLPIGTDTPCPTIIFSHGLGGSRKGGAYLGEFWAGHGYAVVHPQHAGSDEAVWKDVRPARRLDAMRDATRDPRAATNRPADIAFVVDTLERLNADESDDLFGRFDLDRLGMAGHSFGAWTTLAIGGQRFITPRGRDVSMGDTRFDALLPLSSGVPRDPTHYDHAFGTIALPTMHMTGTLDKSVVSDTTPEQRRIPYDHTPGRDAGGAAQYLIIFDGADHMTFSGQDARFDRKADPAHDPVFHRLIQTASLTFWDATLRGDASAQAWLDDGGLEKTVGKEGVVERK